MGARSPKQQAHPDPGIGSASDISVGLGSSIGNGAGTVTQQMICESLISIVSLPSPIP